MVERLGIAVRKGLEVVAVEHAARDQLGEYYQQTVGVRDGAGDQGLVDHRQPFVVLTLVLRGRNHGPAIWGGAHQSASLAHASAFFARGRVLAALEEGRSMSVSTAGGSPMSLRPTAAAVEPLKAIARRSGKSCSSRSTALCPALRIDWSRLPRRAADAITSQRPMRLSASRASRRS